MTDSNHEAENAVAESLARLFHETYEQLAPIFGYETRPESAVGWENVPEPNRSLMIAVSAEVFDTLAEGFDISMNGHRAPSPYIRRYWVDTFLTVLNSESTDEVDE